MPARMLLNKWKTAEKFFVPLTSFSCPRVGAQLLFAVDFVVDLRTFLGLQKDGTTIPHSNATKSKAIRPPVDIYFLCRRLIARADKRSHMASPSSTKNSHVTCIRGTGLASVQVKMHASCVRTTLTLPGCYWITQNRYQVWMKTMFFFEWTRCTLPSIQFINFHALTSDYDRKSENHSVNWCGCHRLAVGDDNEEDAVFRSFVVCLTVCALIMSQQEHRGKRLHGSPSHGNRNRIVHTSSHFAAHQVHEFCAVAVRLAQFIH